MSSGVSIVLLYGNLLTGWWGWDDPQFLRLAYQYKPWEYFFIPHVWREAQPANLNPWNIFSFDLDLTLFGLNPSAFYAHHLFSLWLVAGGTYLLLRLWLGRLWAATGVALFLCSAPVTTVIHQLMNRHYLEGLLFTVLVFYLYVRALREGRPFLAWLGAIAFFFATSAKEVYVVQVLLFPLIPEQTLRKRLSMAAPFFMTLVIYALWRRYMLGRWIGGYGLSLEWSTVSPMISKIPSFIFGHSAIGMACALLTAALVIFLAWRRPSSRLLILGAALMLLGPILPVINISDPQRLLFFSCWALSIAIVFGLEVFAGSSVGRRVLALTVLLVLGFCTASQGWKIRPSLKNAADGFAAHGRFIMEADENEVLLPSIRFGNWYATGLLWLRKNVLGEQPPIIVFDEIDMGGQDPASLRFFRYDDSRRCMQDVTGQIRNSYEEWQRKLQKRPLSVQMNYTDGMLSWELGPYRKGEYSIITYGEFGSKLRIPYSGVQRIEMPNGMLFRVRFDSSEGWIVYSPLLHFDGKALIRKDNRDNIP
ncbi:MAG: hypothetical protein ISS66_14395 [Desulfobacteraceae bacterium]|nr:hypothetical protein [Desulfobacteraceae bacterium]